MYLLCNVLCKNHTLLKKIFQRNNYLQILHISWHCMPVLFKEIIAGRLGNGYIIKSQSRVATSPRSKLYVPVLSRYLHIAMIEPQHMNSDVYLVTLNSITYHIVQHLQI